MTVADSLIYPQESDSTYPYTDTGDREFLEDKEFIETMTLTTHLAAVTETLRFTPFVLKLPVRPPVLVAKQASSIAFLSGNRLGLGIGPLARGRRTSPRSASRGSGAASGWTSASTSSAGSGPATSSATTASSTRSPPLKQCPAPTEPIPLLVGGHSDAALRRAVLKGDGWMHAGGDGEELDAAAGPARRDPQGRGRHPRSTSRSTSSPTTPTTPTA